MRKGTAGRRQGGELHLRADGWLSVITGLKTSPVDERKREFYEKGGEKELGMIGTASNCGVFCCSFPNWSSTVAPSFRALAMLWRLPISYRTCGSRANGNRGVKFSRPRI
jgi:hypothetical protein